MAARFLVAFFLVGWFVAGRGLAPARGVPFCSLFASLSPQQEWR